MAHVRRREVTGILLAGGASSRMGTDKATLDFLGAPMIAWCAAALAECAPALVVVSSSEAHAARCARAVEGAWPRFTVLRGIEVEARVDETQGGGPLGGFVAGLEASRTPSVVLSACDTPLVPARFYREAVALLSGNDGVMPDLGAPEPLISAWRRERAVAPAKDLLSKGRGPRALAEVLDIRRVRAPDLSSWGIDPALLGSANTPEALAALSALYRARAPRG